MYATPMSRRHSALGDRIAAGMLDAAAAVLAERGPGVSMAEIAQAVGVGRATLYRYFPNRDALLQGLAEMALRDMRVRIADAGLDTVDVPGGIARLARILVAGGSKYLAIAPTPGNHAHPDEETDRQVGEPIRALLRRGITDGTLRQDLSPEVLAALLRGLVEQSVFLVMHKELGVEQASDAVASVFLNGAARLHDRPL
jgi:TetR/AcrR family transcriptional regulator, mexCD-oprJ operon repressor